MPATPVHRLQGRYAICTVAGLTLNVFDWEMEVRVDYADGTGHGDPWDVPVPLKYNWTARVRGYFDTASPNSYLAAFANQIDHAGPTAWVDQTPIAFVAYASANTATPVFHANGFVTRARFAAPMAMAEQELEMRGSGQATSIP